MENLTIKILYWAEQEGKGLYQPPNIEEFYNELNQFYNNTIVHARPGDLGGINELIIELISSLSLQKVAEAIALGTAYDLVKEGAKSFVLRPFIEAYRRLKLSNNEFGLDVSNLTLTFQDSIIKIHKITDDGIMDSLKEILYILSEHYINLVLPDGEIPFEIYIPVFEDPSPNADHKFRLKRNVDETIPSFEKQGYTKFWGLYYDYSRCFKTYDVLNNQLIDDGFFIEDNY